MPIYARRILKQAAKYLLIGVALLYAVDWSVFETRFMLGVGLASVPVEQYLTTSLKGGKAEYDYIGTANVNCSRSVFPQYAERQWNPPCWWLKRHNQRWR